MPGPMSLLGGDVSTGGGGLPTGGGASAYRGGEGLCMGEGVCLCRGGGLGRAPSKTAKAGGTHPTGMLSCCIHANSLLPSKTRFSKRLQRHLFKIGVQL